MNTTNPLSPQNPLEQKPRNRSNVYIAVFAILLFHVVLLGALLLQGCKERPASSIARDNPIPTSTPSNPFDQPPTPGAQPGMTGTAAGTTPAGPTTPTGPAVAGPTQPGPIPTNPYTQPGQPVPPLPGQSAGAPAGDVPPLPTAGADYTVAKGDSFYSIAKKNNTTLAAITKANPGVDSKKLKIGQKIKLPEAGAVAAAGAKPTDAAPMAAAAPAPAAATSAYVVKKGDTLTKIARANGVTPKVLRTANHLSSDNIRVGQKLKIPGKAAKAPAEAVVPAGPAAAPAAGMAPTAATVGRTTAL